MPHWRTRRLRVGDGHVLQVEASTALDAPPVLFLHGGPGSGCTPGQKALFAGGRYRAVFVDQRGAGRSTPQGSTVANTTAHLVADLERLRRKLGIERWLVVGGSWGCTLALAYAQAYPQVVAGLLLRGIFLGSSGEIRRYAQSAAQACGRGENGPLAGWAASIRSADENEAGRAVRDWINHERALLGEASRIDWPDAAQVARIRLQMHYLEHACFLEPGQLLAGIERIRHLPAAIVHGTADPVCPPAIALLLHERWPEARWRPVPGGGHALLSEPLFSACREELAWLAGQWAAADGYCFSRADAASS